MKVSGKTPLAQGQVWKTGSADIEILGLGERYIHYKVTSLLGDNRVSAQVSGIEAMAKYLSQTDARLRSHSARN